MCFGTFSSNRWRLTPHWSKATGVACTTSWPNSGAAVPGQRRDTHPPRPAAPAGPSPRRGPAKHEPAARYYTRAGDAAARVYANAEASLYYTRAIELVQPKLSDPAQLAYLYTRRGRAYEVTGQQPLALASYEALEALGRERDQPALVLEALILRAIVLAIPSVVTDAA